MGASTLERPRLVLCERGEITLHEHMAHDEGKESTRHLTNFPTVWLKAVSGPLVHGKWGILRSWSAI